jgi:hypothetical protein
MPTLRHKLKTYFKYKNDNLARELASELYMILYRSKGGLPVAFGGVTIDFKQNENSIEADILKIYLVLKSSNSAIGV